MKRNARITAEPILARDLRPGDLFSTAGPEYWDRFQRMLSVGEMVYVRTEAPPIFGDGDEPVYRITITQTEKPE